MDVPARLAIEVLYFASLGFCKEVPCDLLWPNPCSASWQKGIGSIVQLQDLRGPQILRPFEQIWLSCFWASGMYHLTWILLGLVIVSNIFICFGFLSTSTGTLPPMMFGPTGALGKLLQGCRRFLAEGVQGANHNTSDHKSMTIYISYHEGSRYFFVHHIDII